MMNFDFDLNLKYPMNRILNDMNKKAFVYLHERLKGRFLETSRVTGNGESLNKAVKRIISETTSDLTNSDNRLATELLEIISMMRSHQLAENNYGIEDKKDKVVKDFKKTLDKSITDFMGAIDETEDDALSFDFDYFMNINGVNWGTVRELYLNIDNHSSLDYNYIRAYLIYEVLLENAEKHRKFWLTETEIKTIIKNFIYTETSDEDYDIREINQKLATTLDRLFNDELVLTYMEVTSNQNGENTYACSIYYKQFYSMFRMISERINHTKPIFDKAQDIALLEDSIAQVEQELGYQFTIQQKEAIYGACQNSVFTLTGLAGTGKSTSVRAIVKVFENLGVSKDEILGTSFTGQATYNLRESVKLNSRQSSTIHRWIGQNKAYRHMLEDEDNEDSPETIADDLNMIAYDKVKLIVIDEFSMIDLSLINKLLHQIEDNEDVNIIFVGDLAQLPSINVGFAYDFILSGITQQIQLTEIVRQSDESVIPELANQVRNSEMDNRMLNTQSSDKNFRFISRSGFDESVDIAVKAFGKYYRKFPDAKHHVQAISNTNFYTKSINQGVQSALLDKQQLNDVYYKKTESETIYVGDRVILTKNLVKLSGDIESNEDVEPIRLFNGAKGFVTDIQYFTAINGREKSDVSKITIAFDSDDFGELTFSYDENILNHISLAYATTIHKSQGSTHRDVLMVIGRAGTLNSRQLVNTGLTRTSNTLTLISSPNIIKEAIQKDVYSQARYIYKDIVKELNQNTFD